MQLERAAFVDVPLQYAPLPARLLNRVELKG
jgi:hypothetical protein